MDLGTKLGIAAIVIGFIALVIGAVALALTETKNTTVNNNSANTFVVSPKPVTVPASTTPSQTSSVPFPNTGDGVFTIQAVVHGVAPNGAVGSTTLLLAGSKTNGVYNLVQISKSVLGAEFSASLSLQQGPSGEPQLELVNLNSLDTAWTLFYTFTFSDN
jgi:hypothetical protein